MPNHDQGTCILRGKAANEGRQPKPHAAPLQIEGHPILRVNIAAVLAEQPHDALVAILRRQVQRRLLELPAQATAPARAAPPPPAALRNGLLSLLHTRPDPARLPPRGRPSRPTIRIIRRH